MFHLNMVNYPVFLPLLSTLTWGTFLTLRGTWGFYLNQVLPPRPSKSYIRVVQIPFPFFWTLGLDSGGSYDTFFLVENVTESGCVTFVVMAVRSQYDGYLLRHQI